MVCRIPEASSTDSLRSMLGLFRQTACFFWLLTDIWRPAQLGSSIENSLEFSTHFFFFEESCACLIDPELAGSQLAMTMP